MEQDSINRYCAQMEEIKRRTSVVVALLKKETHVVYAATNIEAVYLQFRKILELIAFGSLVANKQVYSAVYSDYASHWRSKQLLKKLSEVNPDFYPQPIKEVPSQKPGIKNDLEHKTTGFLTKEEFVELYDQSSSLIHVPNPFSTPINYELAEKEINNWSGKIKELLNSHIIQLVGDPNFHLIHMKEDRDDRVHHYAFAPVQRTKSNQ